ncbi:MAG: hypothetical protein HYR56_14550 [Acidobacteria bacterium]|nr:hypothetical protein [Acidobacteriota bacterium]MBI3425761.1 hypothetical protein [Acidobacteriota bacterium]
MLNWSNLVPLLITTITVVVGWVIAHRLNAARDLQNKRREIRVSYLIEAFRKIERGSIPEAKAYKQEDFETAITDVQLFGSVEQVDLAHQFAEAASKGEGASLDLLLLSLRNELRKELDLDEVTKPVRPFRIQTKRKL